jgi:hypothetical protein
MKEVFAIGHWNGVKGGLGKKKGHKCGGDGFCISRSVCRDSQYPLLSRSGFNQGSAPSRGSGSCLSVTGAPRIRPVSMFREHVDDCLCTAQENSLTHSARLYHQARLLGPRTALERTGVSTHCGGRGDRRPTALPCLFRKSSVSTPVSRSTSLMPWRVRERRRCGRTARFELDAASC